MEHGQRGGGSHLRSVSSQQPWGRAGASSGTEQTRPAQAPWGWGRGEVTPGRSCGLGGCPEVKMLVHAGDLGRAQWEGWKYLAADLDALLLLAEH